MTRIICNLLKFVLVGRRNTKVVGREVNICAKKQKRGDLEICTKEGRLEKLKEKWKNKSETGSWGEPEGLERNKLRKSREYKNQGK